MINSHLENIDKKIQAGWAAIVILGRPVDIDFFHHRYTTRLYFSNSPHSGINLQMNTMAIIGLGIWKTGVRIIVKKHQQKTLNSIDNCTHDFPGNITNIDRSYREDRVVTILLSI